MKQAEQDIQVGYPGEKLVLGDDMEFDDTDTPADFEVIDGAGWNPYRDQEPHVRELYGKQVAALMSEVLGADYDVLEAFIVRRWTAKEIGETQGYKNRATASACRPTRSRRSA